MRFRSLAAGLALALVAAPAVAQTPGTLKLVDGGPTSLGGYSAGPYDGQLTVPAYGPGSPTIDIYCVDFAHWATRGATWHVNVTRLGVDPLTATRLGSVSPAPAGFTALEQYQQMAWLAGHYYATPFDFTSGYASNAQVKTIQGAIWNLLTPSAPDAAATSTTLSSNQWLADARNRYTEKDAAFYSQFVVLSPDPLNGPHSQQEFLARVVTPEPATYALLGTGLLGLGGFARLRRRRDAE